MRTLVHRRHSLREPGTDSLSRAGVALARHIGRSSGRFDRVVASPKTRAVETARAMGYRVDDELPELGEMPDEVGRAVGRLPESGFNSLGELVDRVREVREFARAQARAWRAQLEAVPDGGRLLMVSHAGIIELGTVAALGPRCTEWGPGLGPLEGVELVGSTDGWTRGRVLRVAPDESAP